VPEKSIAIVPAGGVGARVGAGQPKQFLDLSGIPALARAVASVAWCDRVVVVHHPDYRDRSLEVLEEVGLAARVTLVPGGPTRRHSISAGLDAVADAGDDVPLVLQNAASPNTPRELIAACLDGLSTHDVVVAYTPATHTIFFHDGREMSEVLPRARLGYTADPTVYRLGALRRIQAAQANALGEGQMTIDTARALGMPVLLVPSPETNLKLTVAADVVILDALLASTPLVTTTGDPVRLD
jgi:2-C-methyl-D-erythritol 4-phosphate cytidylyltransferase